MEDPKVYLIFKCCGGDILGKKKQTVIFILFVLAIVMEGCMTQNNESSSMHSSNLEQERTSSPQINDPCENVRCYPECYGCEYWAMECENRNGEPVCVKDSIIERNSKNCGCEGPCENVTCNSRCYGYDSWAMKCVDGECVKDYLIEKNSTQCDYREPSPEIFCTAYAPEKILPESIFDLTIQLINQGDGKAENVRVFLRARPSGYFRVVGVSHPYSGLAPYGIEIQVGTIYPGERINVVITSEAPSESEVGKGMTFEIRPTYTYFGISREQSCWWFKITVGDNVFFLDTEEG
jgi:hypothetical protein